RCASGCWLRSTVVAVFFFVVAMMRCFLVAVGMMMRWCPRSEPRGTLEDLLLALRCGLRGRRDLATTTPRRCGLRRLRRVGFDPRCDGRGDLLPLLRPEGQALLAGVPVVAFVGRVPLPDADDGA